MSDDELADALGSLVAELAEGYGLGDAPLGFTGSTNLIRDAAARLRELEAEVERLRAEVRVRGDALAAVRERRDKAEAHRARLLAVALRDIPSGITHVVTADMLGMKSSYQVTKPSDLARWALDVAGIAAEMRDEMEER